MSEPRKDLGWINGWWEVVPPIVRECRKAHHKLIATDLDKRGRGAHTVYYCPICNYEFHADGGG